MATKKVKEPVDMTEYHFSKEEVEKLINQAEKIGFTPVANIVKKKFKIEDVKDTLNFTYKNGNLLTIYKHEIKNLDASIDDFTDLVIKKLYEEIHNANEEIANMQEVDDWTEEYFSPEE